LKVLPEGLRPGRIEQNIRLTKAEHLFYLVRREAAVTGGRSGAECIATSLAVVASLGFRSTRCPRGPRHLAGLLDFRPCVSDKAVGKSHVRVLALPDSSGSPGSDTPRGSIPT